MGEPLGEVSEKLSGGRIDLFGQEPEVVCGACGPVEELGAGVGVVVDGERVGEPVRADQEGPFFSPSWSSAR